MEQRDLRAVVVDTPAVAETLDGEIGVESTVDLDRAREQARLGDIVVVPPRSVDVKAFAAAVAPAAVLYIGGSPETVGQIADAANADWVPAAAAESPSRIRTRVRELAERTENARARERHEAFVELISHDLRNPLHVAHSSVELLESAEGEHVDRLDRSLDRIARLVEDGVTFVRQSAAEIEPATVSFEAIARRAWPEPDRVELEFDEETPQRSYLRADTDALEQLLSELFENAIEHGEPPVAAGRTADGFYIADGGPGIDDPDRAFEPGYSETPTGTGLGLATVREIARAHGWTVSVSDADGARIEVRGVAAG